jgi:DNA ligase-1
MREQLVWRREMLAETCAKLAVPEVVFSATVIGAGTAFYRKVVDAGHEGVMAKLQSSAYRPGKRASTWKKIKPRARKLLCTSEQR